MDFYKNTTLKARWMILISLAIVLAVCITVIFNQWSVRKMLNEENQIASANNANNAVDQVTSGLHNYETSLLQFSQLIETELMNNEIDFSQIDKMISTLKENNKDYLTVYFMDFASGKLHVAPEINYKGDVRDSDTYAKLLKNPNLQWVEIYLDESTQTLMTSIIAPVFKNEQLIGAVGYDIDFSSIGAIRENIEQHSDSKLMILDSNGLIVSSFIENGDGKNIAANNSGKIDGVSDLLDTTLATSFDWLDTSKSEPTNIKQFSWEDTDYTGQIQTMEKNNWKIISLIDKNNFEKKLTQLSIVAWISLAISLLIGCLFGYIMSRKLIGIFDHFKQVIEKTANGDFVSRFETKGSDEISDLANHYNQMLDKVRSLILQVQDNTNAIEHSSNSLAIIAKENEQALTNVSSSIEEIAINTSTQSEKMQEGTTAIHALAKRIESIETNSKQMVQDANEALEEVNVSIKKVQQLENANTSLVNSFQDVTAVTSNLDEKTKSISQVTNLIVQITEQTNLLALNASIEAARAGEHGKGFAVVADEVRTLAESSKAATKDIQQIIISIITDTEKLVSVMQQTNTISNNQKSAVATVDHSIQELAQTLENMKHSIAITMDNVLSMEQQKTVVLSSIDTVQEMSTEVTAETQEIASSVEEQTSATSEVTTHATHLNEQVTTLSKSLSNFKI